MSNVPPAAFVGVGVSLPLCPLAPAPGAPFAAVLGGPAGPPLGPGPALPPGLAPSALGAAPPTRPLAVSSSGLATGHPRKARERAATPADAMDPMTRLAAQFAPPPASLAAQAAAATAPPLPSMEDLLPGLVRRVAWSGDGKRGVVRLEIGGGALAGAEVVVEASEGRVRVALRAPDGVDLGAWQARISERLAARGLEVDRVEIE